MISDEEIILKISPALYFEILLRRALQELKRATHTIERIGTQRLAVFDTEKVAELLGREAILMYLADLLSSFTRIESFTLPVRVRKGHWRKIRYNDMDIDSLIGFARLVDEHYKLNLYKRIADVCLFIMGIFPEYTQAGTGYSGSDSSGTRIPGVRRRAEEYEEKGKRYYRLAAEFESDALANLVDIFAQLAENFNLARKPLEFISQQYLHFRKHELFNL